MHFVISLRLTQGLSLLMRYPPLGSSLLCTHRNEQFAVVFSGACRMTIGGETETITPGDIAHMPANVVHSAEIVGDEDYVFVTAKDTSWGIQGIKA